MKRVLATLDNSLAASPVLATARALAPLLDSEVEALHLTRDGARVAREVAEMAGLPLHTRRGPLVEGLVEAGRCDDVVALVIGARGTPAGPRPLGSTALAVATSLPKPVVVVPPDACVSSAIRRVLVPIEGKLSPRVTPHGIIELTRDAKLDMVALHVYQEDSLPAFTDQAQHEPEAWAQEFIRRYCRWRAGNLWLETRVGRAAELVPLVAEEVDADIVALGWALALGPGHAPVVRGVLDRCSRPVLLVPVDIPVVV